MSEFITHQTKVAIIITAWNQLSVTADCLKSVTALHYSRFEIILIDNGSEPPLEPLLTAEFPHLQFVRNERNLGFAGAILGGYVNALAGDFQTFSFYSITIRF